MPLLTLTVVTRFMHASPPIPIITSLISSSIPSWQYAAVCGSALAGPPGLPVEGAARRGRCRRGGYGSAHREDAGRSNRGRERSRSVRAHRAAKERISK